MSPLPWQIEDTSVAFGPIQLSPLRCDVAIKSPAAPSGCDRYLGRSLVGAHDVARPDWSDAWGSHWPLARGVGRDAAERAGQYGTTRRLTLRSTERAGSQRLSRPA